MKDYLKIVIFGVVAVIMGIAVIYLLTIKFVIPIFLVAVFSFTFLVKKLSEC